MALVEDYHYKVVDHMNVVQGYFSTKGLAHQYLMKEYPHTESKNKPGTISLGYPQNIMPGAMYVIKCKR